MRCETVSTFWVKIYLSGPIEVAKQIIRRVCLQEGLCVTIEPTTYIYTGGEEIGYVVGLLNYPRFPTSNEALSHRAEELADELMQGTYHHSVLIVNPSKSYWFSRREEILQNNLQI
jgi:hypothetical protein